LRVLVTGFLDNSCLFIPFPRSWFQLCLYWPWLSNEGRRTAWSHPPI